MKKSEDRVPAEAFHPGEFIKEELEARGWSVHLLAEYTGLTSAALEELIAGRVPVTPSIARCLGDAFGTGQIYWLNLQRAWDAKREAERRELIERAVSIRAEIEQIFAGAAHWNEHVRTPFEKPIDPDPDGQLARLTVRLDRMINS